MCNDRVELGRFRDSTLCFYILVIAAAIALQETLHFCESDRMSGKYVSDLVLTAMTSISGHGNRLKRCAMLSPAKLDRITAPSTPLTHLVQH